MRAWIKPTMEEYGEIYTAYEWHMVDDDGRVVVYMQNRRDNPEPGAPPIDFPGMTVLQYAGDGQFSLEEDFWSLPEGIETLKQYVGRVQEVRPGLPDASARAATGATARSGRRARPRTREPRRDRRLRSAMPEAPQMQALAERVEAWLGGATFEGYEPLGFTGLKTYDPPPEALVGARSLERVDRRAKYVIAASSTTTCASSFHLSQAGRLDFEEPPKKTKPKGSVVRWKFSDDRAVLLREYGTERKAGWWVLAPGDDGPLEKLGPEATSDEFAEWLRTATDGRRIHTILRDQRTVAGVGRGYADDILHRAKLSPYASLKSLKPDERERLLAALHEVLAEGLERERTREGGLSQNKLGEHFTVHGKAGVPCPECGDRPEARLVRVARGRVLPDVPDRRQGARRPPAVAPRQVVVDQRRSDVGLPDGDLGAVGPGGELRAHPRR